eukprot:TRINITY_DN12093_c0_g1_i2.p1 TRINITY_DN12093_c0_g1~~TRINITY_DN12093_c0_g1_i2.p1  ORF type:complete len:320 (+),score=48.22 TRINITY_DN12093_c0_g1_i2:101-1060(+)
MKLCLLQRASVVDIRVAIRHVIVMSCLHLALAGHPHQKHHKAHTAVHAAKAAAAAKESRQSAKVAEHISLTTSKYMQDAVAALRITQGALQAANCEADAQEIGHVVVDLEEKCCDDAEVKRLEDRLERLRVLNRAKFKDERSVHDFNYRAQLHDIDVRIVTAEKKLYRILVPAYVRTNRIDYDSTIVPFPGEVEAFGGRGTARALTSDSIGQSHAMVDSIERAQGMESKRAVHRALTHLRGATITAYDGIARAHMKNVDQFAKTHRWRETHRIRHLAEEESDVHHWAFPAHDSDQPAENTTASAPETAPALAPAPEPAE